LTVIVVLDISGPGNAADLAAAIDAQCHDLLVERRPARLSADLFARALVAEKDPAWPLNIACRCMRCVSGRCKDGHLPILQPPFDDMPLIGIRLADPDIYVVVVCINGHIPVSRSVVLVPMLNLPSLERE